MIFSKEKKKTCLRISTSKSLKYWGFLELLVITVKDLTKTVHIYICISLQFRLNYKVLELAL